MKISHLFFLTICIAIFFSFYKYFYTANYDMRIEMPCDPESGTCEYRPCDQDENECLPNRLSYYQTYIVKAYDFKRCDDDTCAKECESKIIECRLEADAE